MSKVGVLHVAKYSRDVETVKKYARCCMYITSEGITVLDNPYYRIEVLAVIGPYQDDNLIFPEAVLLEIGLSRGKPYREATGIKNGLTNGHGEFPKYYPDRHPHLTMTAEQYQLVAPEIFKYLEQYAVEKVAAWKNDWNNPMWIKAQIREHKNWFSGLTTDKKGYIVKPAIRFAVSVHDQFMVSDVYWAELFGTCNVHDDLKKLVIYIHGRLGGFKRSGRVRFPKDWMIFNKFAEAITALKRVPYHIQVFLWKQHFPLPYYFHEEIMEKIGYDGNQIWEEQMVEKVLPNPLNRVAGISMRVVRRSDRFVVFEILPASPEIPEIEEEDEIPF